MKPRRLHRLTIFSIVVAPEPDEGGRLSVFISDIDLQLGLRAAFGKSFGHALAGGTSSSRPIATDLFCRPVWAQTASGRSRLFHGDFRLNRVRDETIFVRRVMNLV